MRRPAGRLPPARTSLPALSPARCCTPRRFSKKRLYPLPLSRICAVSRKSAFYRRTQPEGCAVLQQQNKRAGLCRVFIGQYFEAAWLMPCRLFSHPQKGRWFFADCGKRAASFSVFRFSGLPRAGGRQIHGKQPHKRRKEVPFPCRRQVSIQEQAVFC